MIREETEMVLEKLLEKLSYEVVQGNVKAPVTELVFDSRKACPDGVFVCISGAVVDGHTFITEVVKKGITSIIIEKDVEVPAGVNVIKVPSTRYALACMSAAYFGYPAEQLKTIGITGTKGKTTTSYMVKSILERTGFRTGLIGTIETIIGDKHIPAVNTTPESYIVQKTFREMVDAGIECVVMEVSSQGLMLHRVGGFTFDYGIFTNLEPDHIGPNEHKDFEEYMACKGMLFKQCKVGIVNADDSHTEQVLAGHTCEIESFGFSEKADLRAQNVELVNQPGFLGVSYDISGKLSMKVSIDVPGNFSVYNSLAAIAICRHFGVKDDAIKEALSGIRVKGRVELLPVSDRFTVMIDYAHNAMSLERLLTTLKAYHPKRLVCMFGCGGNRSKLRRYEMGEVSSKLADLTVITSDNPRNEEPQAIMEDILTGVQKADGKYVMIADRKEAIRYCLVHAEDGDVIVLAGKGHEDYQEIQGKKYHMDERELVAEVKKEENIQ